MTEKSPKDMTFAELRELLNYIPKNRLLDTNEVAEIVGLKPITLRLHRMQGTGPMYFQPPGSNKVKYSEVDVLRWIASGRKQSTYDLAS